MIAGTLKTTYSSLALERPHKYSSFDMSTNIPHEDAKIDLQGDFDHVESRLPESKQDAADHACLHPSVCCAAGLASVFPLRVIIYTE